MAVTLLQFTFYSILIGFVIDLLVGDPRWFPHPVVGIGKLISLLEKGFRRIFPKTPAGETAAAPFWSCACASCRRRARGIACAVLLAQPVRLPRPLLAPVLARFGDAQPAQGEHEGV